jgi:hypothetical protein
VVNKFAVGDPALDRFLFDLIEVEFFGNYLDLCGLESLFPGLVYSRNKSLPQAAAVSFRKIATLLGLKVPSARHRIHGQCQPNIVCYEGNALTPIGVVGQVEFQVIQMGRFRRARRIFTPSI